MAGSNRLSTPSEGEILESDYSEKANQSQPSANGKSVDRRSRRASTTPRSPSPPGRARHRDRNYRSRSRSRSPYREQRGAKRAREDDHYDRRDRQDPRSFKGYYESSRRDRDDRGSYRDYDRGGNSISSLRYDDRHSGRPRDKRQRTRSRSPPRFSDNRSHDDHRKRDTGSSKLSHRDKEERYSREQSVNEDRAKRPLTAVSSSRTDAEQRYNQTQRGSKDHSNGNGKSRADETENGIDKGNGVPDGPLDEAALIEQRRKRREAIKAKHRGQATPMLVQALNLSNASTPSATPGIQSQQTDAAKSTPPPDSPREISGPNSPAAFTVAKDSDLANSTVPMKAGDQDDGPSAADYDPTQDMEDDRMKQGSHQQGNEVSSKTYDETTNDNQDILIPDNDPDQQTSKPAKDEFDMFADDDDMFAEEPKPGENGESTKAVPVAKAKALDMSMLDDWDDDEGYYKIILGELLDSRYHVQLNLGRGMFSAVVRAQDEITKKLVAIKIIRANDTMRKAALKELEILATLKEADPDDKKHMIRLERHFEHKGHLCMVFEHLSINLREVLKKFGRDVGINLKAVRAYAQQMFLGLSLLRKCNILHADIKPDNVLVNESRNMLKICDLGSASDASENEITPYLVSRFYRAPEIILGMPYDFAIDMWSIGCTLFELYTGKILFTGRTNNQMLKSIMECRGKFSHKALRKAEFAHLHFDDLLNFRSVEKDKLTGKDTIRILSFTKPTRDLRSRIVANAKGVADVDGKELNHFVDLVERCLTLNPEKRCTPAEALKHPFIMRMK